MKKILVAFLSVMMLIAFTACDNDAKAYADYETSKALVDAISMQKLVGDFKSMLSGTPVTGLEPAIDVQNEEGDAEDKVVVTLTIAEGGYAVSNVENPVKITKGTATVSVYGTETSLAIPMSPLPQQDIQSQQRMLSFRMAIISTLSALMLPGQQPT